MIIKVNKVLEGNVEMKNLIEVTKEKDIWVVRDGKKIIKTLEVFFTTEKMTRIHFDTNTIRIVIPPQANITVKKFDKINNEYGYIHIEVS